MVSGLDKKEVGIGATAYSAGTDLSLQLKAAKKEGRLSEALLDRRAKLKRSVDYDVRFESFSIAFHSSDRFC